LVVSVVSAGQAARDAAAVLLRAVDAVVAPQAAQGAAEVPQQEAEVWVGAAAQRPEAPAGAEEVARQREARGAAGVLLRAARPSAALPSGAPYASRRDRLRRRARPAP
jgi:hypothetical protein